MSMGFDDDSKRDEAEKSPFHFLWRVWLGLQRMDFW
jgi:hypothetical protein